MVDKVYTDDSLFGVFEKGEVVTGLTSGATDTVLAEDNGNAAIYIEQNRFFQVGEIITGGSSKALVVRSPSIKVIQFKPFSNFWSIGDIDKTITDFLDQFRDSYLTTFQTLLDFRSI